MVAKKPRIVIVGAGMAGLTAANKLYTGSEDKFEVCVVEGGTRIGGRINTSEFGGDRIEMGATWIHGIGGSPVHQIAQEIHSLESDQPWECMDGFLDDPKTVAEGGFEVDPSLVESTSNLFKSLMDYAQGKSDGSDVELRGFNLRNVADKASSTCKGKLSVGSFLRVGIDAYCEGQDEVKGCENWSRKMLERAVFAIHENTQRTYTSAGDLMELDFDAESEYRMFPGEEITIAKGYISIIESLASVLPRGLIQFGRKVEQIEWQAEGEARPSLANGHTNRPVKLHLNDGSIMEADHVIVTMSLGVLKAGIARDSGMFSPSLPDSKVDAISRLGYGVVNKLFLQLSTNGLEEKNHSKFPLLQLAFHPPDSDLRLKQIPWWVRKTASLCPIYKNSSVLLAWFAGEEAHELESLPDKEIIKGVSTTLSCFPLESPNCNPVKFTNVLKTKWGSDPLFLGSYSYIAVGSSGEDIDKLAEPLPKIGGSSDAAGSVLQVLFAGEATHRTHYSTTHGAYFSGLREANRLLQYYHCL